MPDQAAREDLAQAAAGDLPGAADRARVLILDEPTSALPGDAAFRLAETTRRLVERGLAVLYISHYLEEVMRVAQRVSVLRDGRIVLGGAAIAEVGLDTLVTAMLGAAGPAAPVAARRARAVHGGPSLELRGVTVPGRLTEVSLDAPAGEIVGLAGLQGAGHLAVLEVVCGQIPPAAGTVRLPGGGAPRSLRHTVGAGVAYISGDRRGRGLMLDKALWENVTAVRRLGLGRDGMMPRQGRLLERTRLQMARLRIRGRPGDLTGDLSGGNQQKAVFAKWLDASPQVVVLDDPTRGVDIGARAEMHEIIRDLAGDGRIVLVASTDLMELAELCHRVLVFQHGRVVDELDSDRLAERELSLAMNAGFAAAEGE
ncbi:ATP-binding cassette domain-containing protein [Actinomadura scrupuli]|uniref:ATP-binding cassette domain-containing protein n=1 Tax=Actinomadura scrupuli TaxID=559629 RepID=UPI003D99857F